MANTIAIATGTDKNGRQKETHRLGSHNAMAQANTWRTYATVYVQADGSGYALVIRNGQTLSKFEFGPEDAL